MGSQRTRPSDDQAEWCHKVGPPVIAITAKRDRKGVQSRQNSAGSKQSSLRVLIIMSLKRSGTTKSVAFPLPKRPNSKRVSGGGACPMAVSEVTGRFGAYPADKAFGQLPEPSSSPLDLLPVFGAPAGKQLEAPDGWCSTALLWCKRTALPMTYRYCAADRLAAGLLAPGWADETNGSLLATTKSH